MFIKLAIKSLIERKSSVLLSLLALTVSVLVLLGVEHIRHQAKESFASTVSGVDLIVGARTGQLNLLLYSVFRIGAPTNNMSWSSFERLADDPKVNWAIPLSLGDSHKGYRVLGTTQAYFQHFRYGQQSPLTFSQGRPFKGTFDVVLGAAVAKQLNYKLGSKLTLSHGFGHTSFSQHKDNPFTVVGILAPTGTPVDQTLHVSLASIEAIHQHDSHEQDSHAEHHEHTHHHALVPDSITAAMLGLQSKVTTFQVQRSINDYAQEPLTAILPGVALSELWQMMSVLEKTLLLVSALVFIAACLGMSAMLLSSIRERNREIQLLRVIGASPLYLFFLIQLEAFFITLLSILLGMSILGLSLHYLQSNLIASLGLQINTQIINLNSVKLILAVLLTSVITSAIPSIKAYFAALKY